MSSTTRLDLVHEFVSQYYTSYTLTMVAGDASFRKYYRITSDDTSIICMDSDPSLENNTTFLNAHDILSPHSVRVPNIMKQDFANGLFLLEDFGDTLFATYNALPIITKYQLAIDSLIHLQHISLDTANNIEHYDTSHLMRELNLCKEWFNPQFDYDTLFDFIVSEVTTHPMTLVHRDYHSRNLMMLESQKLSTIGIIDFQDLIIGSYVYDLASLLKDVYIKLSDTVREELLGHYFARSPFCEERSYATFKRDFELIGVQRHIKILGIFTRLSQRDGKHQYLDDIPLTQSYLKEMALIYPELSDLSTLCQSVKVQS